MSDDPHTFSWPDGQRAAVSLSFDDARLSQPDQGLPILDRLGVRGTFYVSPHNLPARLEAWRQAVCRGHEIGNHTVSHPCSGNFAWSRHNALEDYTLERMEGELLQANAIIHETLGVKPTTFAYPCAQTFVGRGSNQQSYVPLVARYFEIGRHGLNESPAHPTLCDLALVPCFIIDHFTWDQVGELVEQTMRENAWLILVGHEVRDSGAQSTLPDTLEKLCAFCRDPAHGIWIDTVAAIGQHVKTHRKD